MLQGVVRQTSIYRAVVRNTAQLGVQPGGAVAGRDGWTGCEGGGFGGVAGAVEAAG